MDDVSTPHTYNDVDSFKVLANAFERRHRNVSGPRLVPKAFQDPGSSFSNSKVIIEFERIKQGARFYINGRR